MEELELATIIIIAANVIISYTGFNDFGFFNKYKFEVGAIQNGEWLRIFTPGFLHANWTHLFVNMLTLYFFANVVIVSLGTVAFLVIYLGSLVLGNLLSLYFHKDDSGYDAVGASGAVMGVLYSAILLYPDMMLGLFFIIPVPAYIFGIGYLLYSIYGMKSQHDNIGHDAHFGGAMGGYFITMAFFPQVFTLHLTMVFLLAVPILVLFILKKTGKL